MATFLEQLLQLLWKGTVPIWNKEDYVAFETAKQLVQFDNLLLNVNPNMELVIVSGASNYRIGAVVAYKMPVGSSRCI